MVTTIAETTSAAHEPALAHQPGEMTDTKAGGKIDGTTGATTEGMTGATIAVTIEAADILLDLRPGDRALHVPAIPRRLPANPSPSPRSRTSRLNQEKTWT